MSFQKEKITEELAAAKFVLKVMESAKESFPTIVRGMKDLFKERFTIKDEIQAAFDLALASIALGLQAIRNLTQAQQAERIQAWILRCINTREYGDYAMSEIKEYDQAFQKGIECISQGEDPIMAVSARLLHRWLGNNLHKHEIVIDGKRTGVIDPMLVMMTADVLMRYAGVWKALSDAFEVSGSDLPHDFPTDYDGGALGLHDYRPESEKQKPDGTIRYSDEHGNIQAQGAGTHRKATNKTGIGLTRGNWILLCIAALIFGLFALIDLLEKHSSTSPRESSPYAQPLLKNDHGMPDNIHGQASSYSSPIRNSTTSAAEPNPWEHLSPRDIFTDPEFHKLDKDARRVVASKVLKDFTAAKPEDQDATLDAPITYWQEYFKKEKPVVSGTIFGPQFSDFAVTFKSEPSIQDFEVVLSDGVAHKGVRAELSSGNSFQRAEVFRMPKGFGKSEIKESAMAKLREYAKHNGLTGPELKWEHTSVGWRASVRGTKILENAGKQAAITYEALNYYGDSSLFVLYVGGFSESYPPSQVVEFIKSIRLKQRK